MAVLSLFIASMAFSFAEFEGMEKNGDGKTGRTLSTDRHDADRMSDSDEPMHSEIEDEDE